MTAPGLIFRQLFDAPSSTYTYLLADPATQQALLIDPVFEQARRDTALLRELGLTLVATLDTHVHADHVTAAWLHRQRCGSRIALSAAAGAEGVDLPLAHGDRVAFGGRHLQVRATPGHTDGCLSVVLDDHTMAFTGDALLIRGCGRTDFQQGSAGRLYHSVHEQLLSLPPACLLYPAHDYQGRSVTTVAEERRWNPRFGGAEGQLPDEGDFVGHMQALHLPHPKQIDRAVPANLRCGRPEGSDVVPPPEPAWAPLVWTFAGLWEIEPAALEERLHAVQVLDVREPHEFTGALGHIDGAQLLPLGALAARQGELARDRPVVTVCRSGARSAQAAVLLGKAGFADVANLAGGMLRWRGQGYPAVGGEGG
jgi:glyoxylase-like metal-dependent hydrolase (beta-lactamase superfamily II)/rhodanese-related sulfurtransferase